MIKSTQRGFTLIELVVVIVILGILAAFAVPRFMGLETEARVATVRSMAGTLQSAAAMAHGVCLAQNCPNANTQITINGVSDPVVFVNQYPNNASIHLLLDGADGFTRQGNRLRKNGAKNPAQCWVQYTQAAANGRPTITFPGNLVLGAPGVTEKMITDQLRTAC